MNRLTHTDLFFTQDKFNPFVTKPLRVKIVLNLIQLKDVSKYGKDVIHFVIKLFQINYIYREWKGMMVKKKKN